MASCVQRNPKNRTTRNFYPNLSRFPSTCRSSGTPEPSTCRYIFPRNPYPSVFPAPHCEKPSTRRSSIRANGTAGAGHPDSFTHSLFHFHLRPPGTPKKHGAQPGCPPDTRLGALVAHPNRIGEKADHSARCARSGRLGQGTRSFTHSFTLTCRSARFRPDGQRDSLRRRWTRPETGCPFPEAQSGFDS